MWNKITSLILAISLCWPLSAGAVQFGAGSGSSYPTTLDTTNTRANKSGGACSSSIASNICAEFTNDLQSAIRAIQLELGTLPKGAFADVAARLNTGLQTPWTTDVNAAGHTLYGSTQASGNLTLDSTSSGTKGYVILNPSGGNVGIGTTTPQRLLHLHGSSAPYIELDYASVVTKSYLYSKGTDVVLTGNMDDDGVFTNTGATAARIIISTTSNDSAISFQTAAINNTVPTTRMTIDKSGTVTIPYIKSTTGARYVCVDTSGTLISQGSACSGS